MFKRAAVKKANGDLEVDSYNKIIQTYSLLKRMEK